MNLFPRKCIILITKILVLQSSHDFLVMIILMIVFKVCETDCLFCFFESKLYMYDVIVAPGPLHHCCPSGQDVGC